MPRRYCELDLPKIDRDARTIPISFSSEYPGVQRADEATSRLISIPEGQTYVEILDHSPDNCDLSLLNNRGAFLDEHSDRDHLGVVEKAEIGADKIGRAVVKMGSDDTSIKRFGQMAENIRPHVSVGYKYTRFIGKEQMTNGRSAYRFAWRGLEISSVAVPADPTVGVSYRNLGDIPLVDSDTQLTESKTISKTMTPEEIAAERAKARTEAQDGERKRSSEIRKIAATLEKDHPNAAEKVRALTSEALSGDMEVGAYQIRAFQECLSAKPVVPITMADLGLNEDEQRAYSIGRAVRSIISAKTRTRLPDGLEGEVHAEMDKRNLGFQSEGFLVPADARVRMGGQDRRSRRLTRDLVAGNFGNGGATVATQLVTPIIEILRNRMVMDRMGIRTMAGLSGNVAIPRQTAAGTAYSVPEITALTTSTQVLDQIAMTPRRVGATGQYSRQLLLQSSIDVENFLRDDLLKVIAIDWDRLIINGQGAGSEPTGILNTPGIGSVTFGGAATWANIVLFETLVAAANADIGEMGYVTTPTARGKLKTIAKLFTGATTVAAFPLWDGNMGDSTSDGMMNGYRAACTNNMPLNQLLFGVFDQAILGLWGGYDVIVDPYTLAKNAEVVVTMNTFGDVVVRHPQSFCASADSAAQ